MGRDSVGPGLGLNTIRISLPEPAAFVLFRLFLRLDPLGYPPHDCATRTYDE